MTDEHQPRHRKRTHLWLALGLVLALLAVAVVPPFLSISRYKSRITRLMSASLGRPVRLSSVELRVLPQPGFVLTDLTVEEDPAYGAEPVLHASTVTASIRLLSLWRGRLEIGTISVDDASLNLVRTAPGRWNLDSIFRTAAQAQPQSGRGGRIIPLPYLEATNSRINVKNGAEKLPWSLLNADLSLWQENPGDWRIRLRGQPARTDVSLDLADTGVVRLEASVRRAPQLRQMPVHVDIEWREAQLGQLARLVAGSDPGWRGDLAGQLTLDGTADAAQIKTRLRASNVHRAEFAPAAPMDFDANCSLTYHYTSRNLEGLVCDSPFGDGHIRLTGDRPGDGRPPHLSVALDHIPAAAALDAVRTVRSGFAAGLEAAGTVSGKLSYAENQPVPPAPARPMPAVRASKSRAAQAHPAPHGPLSGSLSADNLALSGAGLTTPIRLAHLVFQPVDTAPGQPASGSQELAATAAVPAGAPVPLTVAMRLGLAGYHAAVHGQASFARARELARAAGLASNAALDALAGESLAVDLAADGPWVVPEMDAFHLEGAPGKDPDHLAGTLTLRNANWKAGYLASHVEIAQATLHLSNGETRWDPVAFSYGPLKGIATLTLPAACSPQPCAVKSAPSFTVQFGALDANALEAAILGAHEPGTLLSTLIARFTPSSQSPAWPQLQGTVRADSLVLGPIKLAGPSASLHILDNGAEITGLDAGVLGGRVHGTGTLQAAGFAGPDGKTRDKPAYTLEGQFTRINPAAVGQLVGQRWTGGAIDGDGKIGLSGFTGKDLAASAVGTLHFEWRHGSVAATIANPASADESATADSATDEPATPAPPALARFDLWTADAEVATGAITLKPARSQVEHGAHKSAIAATVTLGNPAKISFAAPKETTQPTRP